MKTQHGAHFVLFPTNAEPFLVGTTELYKQNTFMVFVEQVSFSVTINLIIISSYKHYHICIWQLLFISVYQLPFFFCSFLSTYTANSILFKMSILFEYPERKIVKFYRLLKTSFHLIRVWYEKTTTQVYN